MSNKPASLLQMPEGYADWLKDLKSRILSAQQIFKHASRICVLMGCKHAGSRRNCTAGFQNGKKCFKIQPFSIFAFAGKKHQQSLLVTIFAPLQLRGNFPLRRSRAVIFSTSHDYLPPGNRPR
ncbi:MAG TPA: hypothetical protein DCG57_11725 [Candidatus Riflebacteria bacterium]|nr:hypothetical protein [Candidatus Riflebacteria bacterium]